MAIWLIGAYLHSAFPAVPNAVWVLAEAAHENLW